MRDERRRSGSAAGREHTNSVSTPRSPSLLDTRLVDEVRMLVCPTSRGKGTRLFQDRRDLSLIEATAFGNGVGLLRYEIEN
ncbi:hypothetical protein [Jiangella endophytica]|uniref:hypothetical protein n=1 Tax=Jiangella endophytica TaxID=1623398 RepID=UPI0018E4FB85|nr:hypothetical protein [Jiangella endophytica]